MILLVSVRLLNDRYHGLTANGERAEWPPSPFRLFQAMIAGNSQGTSLPQDVATALRWLEKLESPSIVAPRTENGQVVLTYVLNNTVERSRTPKTVRPTLLSDDRHIQYLWSFDADVEHARQHAVVITKASRHIRALGWGIDLAIGCGEILETELPEQISRIRYIPAGNDCSSTIDFRSPRSGSLESLQECYSQYLNRYESAETTQLESGGPIYHLQSYFKGKSRPYAVFKLIDENDDTVAYQHSKLIHIAGMVRSIAIKQMKLDPPQDLRGRSTEEWIDQYVAGHKPRDNANASQLHEQFSFIPLPSTGMQHTDPGIRRVMIAAPAGDDAWLEHLAQHLDGQELKPESGTTLSPGTHLQRVNNRDKDGVRDVYTRESQVWASFTPVILPGHDDHKPEKTRKLILKALAQSGIEQPCEFEWSAYSHFPKSFSAHKYVRDESVAGGKRLIGYIRPDHMRDQTAVHLRITFEQPVPGPIILGAGRHCGFGLMATV